VVQVFEGLNEENIPMKFIVSMCLFYKC